jgi:hypothetical protein
MCLFCCMAHSVYSILAVLVLGVLVQLWYLQAPVPPQYRHLLVTALCAPADFRAVRVLVSVLAAVNSSQLVVLAGYQLPLSHARTLEVLGATIVTLEHDPQVDCSDDQALRTHLPAWFGEFDKIKSAQPQATSLLFVHPQVHLQNMSLLTPWLELARIPEGNAAPILRAHMDTTHENSASALCPSLSLFVLKVANSTLLTGMNLSCPEEDAQYSSIVEDWRRWVATNTKTIQSLPLIHDVSRQATRNNHCYFGVRFRTSHAPWALFNTESNIPLILPPSREMVAILRKWHLASNAAITRVTEFGVLVDDFVPWKQSQRIQSLCTGEAPYQAHDNSATTVTILISTHSARREALLGDLIRHYVRMDFVDLVVVTWHDPSASSLARLAAFKTKLASTIPSDRILFLPQQVQLLAS